MTYTYRQHGCRCGCKYCDENSEYNKYSNADPSTSAYAPRIVDEIVQEIEEKIDKDSRRIYGRSIGTNAILGIDLRHEVIRKLAHRLYIETLKIDDFERENSTDIRNYTLESQE
jgi:DNA repair photolyase